MEIAALVGLFAVVFFVIQGIVVWTDTPAYVFPKPTDIVKTFAQDFTSTEIHSLKVTGIEFLAGLAIGSTVGLLLAALLTQKPFAEKIIAPYILIMVTTPMLAFVPFLRLKMGFGLWPLIIAVALASGPMVMINSATGFRRTDLAKIALARSYGASTFQIFTKIRFPLALPMIIVGFMVGSIFGLLTAIGGEMVAASEQGGLGRDLVYYSSLARMSEFGATILIIADPRGHDLCRLLLHRQALGELGGVSGATGRRPDESTKRERGHGEQVRRRLVSGLTRSDFLKRTAAVGRRPLGAVRSARRRARSPRAPRPRRCAGSHLAARST